MSAPASEGDAANTALTDAYPHDVIIQYIYKPTLRDHWIVTAVILLIIIVGYTLFCEDPSPLRMPSTCGRMPYYIYIAASWYPPLLLLYLQYKCRLLRRANLRRESLE